MQRMPQPNPGSIQMLHRNVGYNRRAENEIAGFDLQHPSEESQNLPISRTDPSGSQATTSNAARQYVASPYIPLPPSSASVQMLHRNVGYNRRAENYFVDYLQPSSGALPYIPAVPCQRSAVDLQNFLHHHRSEKDFAEAGLQRKLPTFEQNKDEDDEQMNETAPASENSQASCQEAAEKFDPVAISHLVIIARMVECARFTCSRNYRDVEVTEERLYSLLKDHHRVVYAGKLKKEGKYKETDDEELSAIICGLDEVDEDLNRIRAQVHNIWTHVTKTYNTKYEGVTFHDLFALNLGKGFPDTRKRLRAKLLQLCRPERASVVTVVTKVEVACLLGYEPSYVDLKNEGPGDVMKREHREMLEYIFASGVDILPIEVYKDIVCALFRTPSSEDFSTFYCKQMVMTGFRMQSLLMTIILIVLFFALLPGFLTPSSVGAVETIRYRVNDLWSKAGSPQDKVGFLRDGLIPLLWQGGVEDPAGAATAGVGNLDSLWLVGALNVRQATDTSRHAHTDSATCRAGSSGKNTAGSGDTEDESVGHYHIDKRYRTCVDDWNISIPFKLTQSEALERTQGIHLPNAHPGNLSFCPEDGGDGKLSDDKAIIVTFTALQPADGTVVVPELVMSFPAGGGVLPKLSIPFFKTDSHEKLLPIVVVATVFAFFDIMLVVWYKVLGKLNVMILSLWTKAVTYVLLVTAYAFLRAADITVEPNQIHHVVPGVGRAAYYYGIGSSLLGFWAFTLFAGTLVFLRDRKSIRGLDGARVLFDLIVAAAPSMFALSILFLSWTIGLILIAMILFGDVRYQYSSFPLAFDSISYHFMGRSDYDIMEENAALMGPIFHIFVNIYVVWFILNMLVAAMFNHLPDVSKTMPMYDRVVATIERRRNTNRTRQISAWLWFKHSVIWTGLNMMSSMNLISSGRFWRQLHRDIIVVKNNFGTGKEFGSLNEPMKTHEMLERTLALLNRITPAACAISVYKRDTLDTSARSALLYINKLTRIRSQLQQNQPHSESVDTEGAAGDKSLFLWETNPMFKACLDEVALDPVSLCFLFLSIQNESSFTVLQEARLSIALLHCDDFYNVSAGVDSLQETMKTKVKGSSSRLHRLLLKKLADENLLSDVQRKELEDCPNEGCSNQGNTSDKETSFKIFKNEYEAMAEERPLGIQLQIEDRKAFVVSLDEETCLLEKEDTIPLDKQNLSGISVTEDEAKETAPGGENSEQTENDVVEPSVKSTSEHTTRTVDKVVAVPRRRQVKQLYQPQPPLPQMPTKNPANPLAVEGRKVTSNKPSTTNADSLTAGLKTHRYHFERMILSDFHASSCRRLLAAIWGLAFFALWIIAFSSRHEPTAYLAHGLHNGIHFTDVVDLPALHSWMNDTFVPAIWGPKNAFLSGPPVSPKSTAFDPRIVLDSPIIVRQIRVAPRRCNLKMTPDSPAPYSGGPPPITASPEATVTPLEAFYQQRAREIDAAHVCYTEISDDTIDRRNVEVEANVSLPPASLIFSQSCPDGSLSGTFYGLWGSYSCVGHTAVVDTREALLNVVDLESGWLEVGPTRLVVVSAKFRFGCDSVAVWYHMVVEVGGNSRVVVEMSESDARTRNMRRRELIILHAFLGVHLAVFLLMFIGYRTCKHFKPQLSSELERHEHSFLYVRPKVPVIPVLAGIMLWIVIPIWKAVDNHNAELTPTFKGDHDYQYRAAAITGTVYSIYLITNNVMYPFAVLLMKSFKIIVQAMKGAVLSILALVPSFFILFLGLTEAAYFIFGRSIPTYRRPRGLVNQISLFTFSGIGGADGMWELDPYATVFFTILFFCVVTILITNIVLTIMAAAGEEARKESNASKLLELVMTRKTRCPRLYGPFRELYLGVQHVTRSFRFRWDEDKWYNRRRSRMTDPAHLTNTRRMLIAGEILVTDIHPLRVSRLLKKFKTPLMRVSTYHIFNLWLLEKWNNFQHANPRLRVQLDQTCEWSDEDAYVDVAGHHHCAFIREFSEWNRMCRRGAGENQPCSSTRRNTGTKDSEVPDPAMTQLTELPPIPDPPPPVIVRGSDLNPTPRGRLYSLAHSSSSSSSTSTSSAVTALPASNEPYNELMMEY